MRGESSRLSMPRLGCAAVPSESHITLDPQSSPAWEQHRKELFNKVDETQPDALGPGRRPFLLLALLLPTGRNTAFRCSPATATAAKAAARGGRRGGGRKRKKKREEGGRGGGGRRGGSGEEEELPPQYFSVQKPLVLVPSDLEEVLEQPQLPAFGHLEASRGRAWLKPSSRARILCL